MLAETLDIVRCPFCGGRLGVVDTLFHRRNGSEIVDAVLGCHCCVFPVVAGIPVIHLDPSAVAARRHLEAGRPDLAMRAMIALEDEAATARFETVVAASGATYRDVVDALGPGFESGYFLYRFSDPTYVVAEAVVRAVASTVLASGGRAIDMCGGSGHVTRLLVGLSSSAPILADLYFSKLWLARRFTAPGCEVVCCDGNAPLPFVAGAFRFAVCSDAFHYIWTKRLLASELMRVVHGSDGGRAVAVTHTHNANEWNASAGMPLPPDAYRDLFDEMGARVFSERGLLDDIVRGGPLDLARLDGPGLLDADPALTIVAARGVNVFRTHALESSRTARGEFRLNPLYAIEPDGDQLRLRLRFPSADYEDEYGAARRYLAEEVSLDRTIADTLPLARLPDQLIDLARRRVILDLPVGYY
jgi:uncharacterized protein YbaR (Trm112 family)